jgi:SAM-dependent methyltransferase
MMLNWLTRYAPAMAALEELGELGSILDVGCGQHGLACVRPDLPFVGLEIEFAGPPAPTMVPFQFAPGPLPFKDSSFDTVLCLDALEHVPRPDREGFVQDLARVAARRLLVACPSTAAQPMDELLYRSFQQRGIATPSWLAEHFEHQLPTSEEIASFVAGVDGFTAAPVPMTNGLLCMAVVLADMTPEVAPASLREAREQTEAWTELLAGARFGDSIRDAWLLEREAPVTALVDTADLRGTARAAVQAPGAVLVGEGPVTAPVALATGARRKLWLAPDWAEPDTWLDPLNTYLHEAPVDGDTCLALDATTSPELTPGEVAALVGTACERIMGDADFAEVLLVDTPVTDEDLLPVASSADVRRALAQGQ